MSETSYTAYIDQDFVRLTLPSPVEYDRTQSIAYDFALAAGYTSRFYSAIVAAECALSSGSRETS